MFCLTSISGYLLPSVHSTADLTYMLILWIKYGGINIKIFSSTDPPKLIAAA